MAVSEQNKELYDALEAFKIEGVSVLTDQKNHHLGRAYRQELKKAHTESHTEFLDSVTNLCEVGDTSELKLGLQQLMEDYVSSSGEKQINISDIVRAQLEQKHSAGDLKLADFKPAVVEVTSMLSNDVVLRCVEAFKTAHADDLNSERKKVIANQQSIIDALQRYEQDPSIEAADKQHAKESLQQLRELERNTEEKLSPREAQGQLAAICIKEAAHLSLQKSRDAASANTLVMTLSTFGSPINSVRHKAGRSPLNADKEHFRILEQYGESAQSFLDNVNALLNKLDRSVNGIDEAASQFILDKFDNAHIAAQFLAKGGLSNQIDELKKEVGIFGCKSLGIAAETLTLTENKMGVIAQNMKACRERLEKSESTYRERGLTSERANFIKQMANTFAVAFGNAAAELATIRSNMTVEPEKEKSTTVRVGR